MIKLSLYYLLLIPKIVLSHHHMNDHICETDCMKYNFNELVIDIFCEESSHSRYFYSLLK